MITQIVYFWSGEVEFRVETDYVISRGQIIAFQKWVDRFQTTPPDWFIEETR